LCILNDYVVSAIGGGGKKFGVRNKLISYNIKGDKLSSEPIHQIEFEKEIPLSLTTFPKLNIFATCLDDQLAFFKMENNGAFNEIFRYKVLDYCDETIFLSVCKFSESGNYFAAGTSDGYLK
jgi:hypothetical protein